MLKTLFSAAAFAAVAATPALAELGGAISERLDTQKDMSNYIGQVRCPAWKCYL